MLRDPFFDCAPPMFKRVVNGRLVRHPGDRRDDEAWAVSRVQQCAQFVAASTLLCVEMRGRARLLRPNGEPTQSRYRD